MDEKKGSEVPRRDFLKTVAAAGAAGAAAGAAGEAQGAEGPARAGRNAPARAPRRGGRAYNGAYAGERLSRVAFPMGGIGAGMICLEGTAALSHVSIRNQPEVFFEPCTFAAICVKGKPNVARILEGPVPGWKIFGQPNTGNGAGGTSLGLPRFRRATFLARFPFATVDLEDPKVPLAVEVTGWSPFLPGDADRSSLPVAGLEYRFTNRSRRAVDAVFSFNAKNFLAQSGAPNAVRAIPKGFVLWGGAPAERPWEETALAAFVDEDDSHVNCAWFRGGWWDPLTMAWKEIQEGRALDRPPIEEGKPSPGGTLSVPFRLEPGASRTIALKIAWYAGATNLRIGRDPKPAEGAEAPPATTHRSWYAGRFAGIDEVASAWRAGYGELRRESARFRDCFHDTTLPPEVVEAVAANLTILKSPTVLRQADGRLWCWEGCCDERGCCHGSCTHVWNYAQAIPHLFPALERTLRETEFGPSQADDGHQMFRSALPIRPLLHDFHAAADGQLGGILKVYRDWRISGDTEWLRKIWPRVKASLAFCIEAWDPRRAGVLEEPHHNTYDIEFWGPDGMCTSFYLAALKAAAAMGEALGEDVAAYRALAEKGTAVAESDLWNGEYFIQKIQWKGLRAKSPIETKSMVGEYSPEAIALLEKEGPKYQYGEGCLSDGVLGSWLALACGAGQVLDREKVKSHLRAVHRYNLKKDLSEHANPQRPSFACGAEGGLLLCTWPKGGKLSLPFVYSDEVWTGIEYQVASHLMMLGLVEEGLDIVRACRDRYDGRVRNPFNEYECGHWYARAMSSYALLEGLSGARYDAVERVLHLAPRIRGDFRAFLSTATGYGTVGVKDGKPFVEVKAGAIDVREVKYTAAV
ncbi:MAG: twin-arginine translocation signal domain-containing protein [Planctomycetes bacterium]|nr:twin-arginine translocation signal domain-containing protein [Planctomycetota bacterium]